MSCYGPLESPELSSLIYRPKTALADRYAIEEEVGSGGMATVSLAEDLEHHRKVSVKVVRPDRWLATY